MSLGGTEQGGRGWGQHLRCLEGIRAVGRAEGHTWRMLSFGINTEFSFYTFLVTWSSSLLTCRRIMFIGIIFPQMDASFSFYKGSVGSRMQRSCRRQKECSVMGKKRQTLTETKVRAPHPTPAPGAFLVGCGDKVHIVGPPAILDTLSLAEARTDSTNPHKARRQA